MKRKLLALSLLVALSAVPAVLTAAEQAPLPPPRSAIALDERLEYSVRWLGIPVGVAVLSTSAAKEPGLKGMTRLEFRGRSNFFLSLICHIRAELTSWVDPATGSPRRFTSRLKRCREFHESTLTFYPARGTCLHELPGNKRAEVPVAPETQDGLSLHYRIRTVPLEVGRPVPLTITADGKNWEVRAQVVRTCTVRLGSMGEWRAVEGRGKLAYPVPFLSGAEARVWLSADEKRIPLMAKIRSRLGPVTVLLVRRSEND